MVVEPGRYLCNLSIPVFVLCSLWFSLVSVGRAGLRPIGPRQRVCFPADDARGGRIAAGEEREATNDDEEEGRRGRRGAERTVLTPLSIVRRAHASTEALPRESHRHAHRSIARSRTLIHRFIPSNVRLLDKMQVRTRIDPRRTCARPFPGPIFLSLDPLGTHVPNTHSRSFVRPGCYV